MAGALVGLTVKNIASGIIFLCFLQIMVPSSAENTDECPSTTKTCQCLYGNAEHIDVDNIEGDYDHRTLGLAAATGALGGILATGTAFAAYFHFRGGGGGSGSESLGGGELGVRGKWRSRSPRPDSADSSADSYGSQSPLTKRDRRDRFPVGSRFRPTTGDSTTSSVTNIYRHSKVWPGRI